MNQPISTSSPSSPAEPAPVAIDADLLCGHCGQNLRGVNSDRCPECGRGFDRGRIIDAAVPWEQRRHIGRFRAYWRTMWIRPNPRMDGEVSLAAARSFRRWTVALVFLTLMVPIIMWKSHDGWRTTTPGAFSALFSEHGEPDWEAAERNPWFFGVSVAALLLWLIAATGIPSWFVHSKRLGVVQERRAVAWTLYASAPLAWVTPLAVLLGTFLWVERNYEWLPHIFYAAEAIVVACTVFIVMTPIAWLAATAFVIGRTTGSSVRGVAALILLPPLWGLLAAVIFVALLSVVNWIALLIYTLR